MSFGMGSGRSGTNATPLGQRRRLKVEETSPSMAANDGKRISMDRSESLVDRIKLERVPVATLMEKPYDESGVKRGRSAQRGTSPPL